jgi:F-type H+-transporting ATPase subunit b
MEFFQANINLGEVLVQLIAFVIVFWAMKLMAWKPLLASLAARRETIRHKLGEIEKAKKEIEQLKAEYTAHLQKIDDESRAKIQQAVDEGRTIAREIQDKARTESQAAFDKAKENIELEVNKARLTLRRDIADLTVNATERVLNEKMSDPRQQQEKMLAIIQDLEKSL